jgi:hypothetical protein
MEAERVGPELEALLARRALAVTADLAVTGLPVHHSGDSWLGDSWLETTSKLGTVDVCYCPMVGCGVFVKWRLPNEILHAVRVAGLRSPETQFGGVALDVITKALEDILTAAGWIVDADNVGDHETSVKVVAGEGGIAKLISARQAPS